MLLAQTFTKVLTSLLSLVTDPFCCGMFALFKTESSSNTVNPLTLEMLHVGSRCILGVSSRIVTGCVSGKMTLTDFSGFPYCVVFRTSEGR